MTDVCADIASYLIAQSVGVNMTTFLSSGGIPITYGYIPPSPQRCIAIFPAGGSDPVNIHNPGETDLRQPRIQVQARSEDIDDAATKLASVYAALNNKAELVINGTRYISVQAEGDTMNLGWYDDGERGSFKLVQNFKIMRSG